MGYKQLAICMDLGLKIRYVLYARYVPMFMAMLNGKMISNNIKQWISRCSPKLSGAAMFLGDLTKNEKGEVPHTSLQNL